MTEKTLNPCPFCGSSDIEFGGTDEEEGITLAYMTGYHKRDDEIKGLSQTIESQKDSRHVN